MFIPDVYLLCTEHFTFCLIVHNLIVLYKLGKSGHTSDRSGSYLIVVTLKHAVHIKWHTFGIREPCMIRMMGILDIEAGKTVAVSELGKFR